MGVVFRQMNASEKAKYGVLPSEVGKVATKSGKAIRKALPTTKRTRKVQYRSSAEKVCSVIASLTDEQKTAGYAYLLTRESFEAVKGLLDGGEDIVMYDDIENNMFRDEIVEADGRILLSGLVLDLQNSKEADELFVIRFILLVIWTILCPTSGVHVNTNYVSLIYFHNVDWHVGYVDRSVPAIAFWSATSVRHIVRYIRRISGYENVKLRKANAILPSVRNPTGPSQAIVSQTLLLGSILNSDGIQSYSSGCKAEISRIKAEVVDEVRRIMKETVDLFRSNVIEVVRKEIELLKGAIVQDFWKAALMSNDPFKNEDESREEDEDTEEDSDSGEDKDEDEGNNVNFGANVNVKNMEEEAQPSNQNFDVSECVNFGSDIIHVVDERAIDKSKDEEAYDKSKNDEASAKGKNVVEKKISVDPIIVYKKSVKKFISSCARTVGLFNLWYPVKEIDFEAEFILSEHQNLSYVVASYEKIELSRELMKCMKLGTNIDSLVICCFAQLLTHAECAHAHPKPPSVWFLPTQVSQKYLGLTMTVNRYAREQEWKERYLGDLSACEHILVPLYADDHWFLADIWIKKRVVEIQDSLSIVRDRPARAELAYEMLETLDTLLLLDRKMAFGDDYRFVDCIIRHLFGIPKQDNGNDCRVFVMMYMEALIFAADERLRISLQLTRHPLNSVKDSLSTDVENFILACRNLESAKPDVDWKQSHSSSSLVRSPSKSPEDRRFAIKKGRKKNIIPHTPCQSRVALKI
ncbi:Ulp1 protease family, C-terminal catalytic domain containing protein [Trema orientale]|uniref:Ulp1 protease family, C-terminal catalytic domain containing protein n=1 Tax=Trema orientale TaxID=63057 RepID=A0A2P5FB96_TREOI|nr:Ulp1 protease family, C-terminal catalytic domain containing protein [Trema orientale]